MSRRSDTDMRRPRSAAHRYQMVVDAVAALDLDALCQLVVTYRATVDEVTRAATQTDRSIAELSAALRPWLAGHRPHLTKTAVDRLVTTLTQPTLMPLEGLA